MGISKFITWDYDAHREAMFSREAVDHVTDAINEYQPDIVVTHWTTDFIGAGGLTHALTIHDIAKSAGVGCWIGGMVESAVGQAFAIALGTLANIRYPCDIFPTSRFYHRDLAIDRIELSGPSQVRAFDGPGIGTEPDPDMLGQCSVDSAVLTA